jgi:hypothetical protein
MSEESSVRDIRPFLLLTSAILIAIVAWHYFCHLRLEAGLENRANEFLRSIPLRIDAIVRIQPITNLVTIQFELPVRAKDAPAQIIGDAIAEYASMKLAPVIERHLVTAARSDIDFYAMVVPYHVAIDVTMVREGFSKIVQDVQSELIRLGYEIGDADGLNGPRTKKAIADVQAQLKMPQDGQASQELLSILRDAKPAPPNTTLERARGR